MAYGTTQRGILGGSIPSGKSIFGRGGDTGQDSHSESYSFTVPDNVHSVQLKCWGAGGGAGNYSNGLPDSDGGGGGFSEYQMTVVPGDILHLIIGAGGDKNSEGEATALDGGAKSGTYSNSGGFTGVFSTNARNFADAIVIAGGGGGGGTNTADRRGGAGGGTSGEDGESGTYGIGGSQVAGGTTNGAQLSGGSDSSPGGGGYYGGGGDNWSSGGGGGGSGYIDTANIHYISGSTSAGSRRNPANVGDVDYASAAGEGGLGANTSGSGHGNNGRIVINWGSEVG